MHPSFPVLNVGSQDNPTYIPANVCVVLPGQPYKPKQDSTQTQSMVGFAVRPPQTTIGIIGREGLDLLGLSGQGGSPVTVREHPFPHVPCIATESDSNRAALASTSTRR